MRVPWLLLVALLLRLAFLPVFEGDDHDGTARTLVAAAWLQHPYQIEGTTPWPLLNYLVPALAIRLSGELYWSVRALYLLVALSNVYLLYLLVHELFDSRSAWLAAFLLAVNPYHIRCSIDGAMSEPPYVSLVLLALFLVARYRRLGGAHYLLGAGLAITLATMFRFDAVLWGGIAGYLLCRPAHRLLPHLADRRTWAAVLILGAACAVYPVLLAVRWEQLYGDPLHFFHTAQLNTQQFFELGRHLRIAELIYDIYSLVFWPASAILILTPLVAGLAFAGLTHALVRRERAELAIGYLLFSAWLMYGAYRHNILAQFRYSLILQVLLLAYFWTGVQVLSRNIPSLSPRTLYAGCWVAGFVTWAAFVSISFMDMGVLTRQFRALSPIQPAPYASGQALAWIRERVGAGERVLVTPEVKSPYLSLKGQDLTVDGKIDRLSNYRPDGMLVYTREELADLFRERARQSTYVLVQVKHTSLGLRDGLVAGLLSPPDDAVQRFEQYGIRLGPRESFGPLRLYRIGAGTIDTAGKLIAGAPPR